MSSIDFSIIIPTYRRPQQISACLGALNRLDYPRERFEVIVSDDGSPDDTRPATEFWSDYFNLTFLTQTNGGPAKARHHAVTKARGEWLVFTDDDCAPTPSWLQAIQKSRKANAGAVLGGQTINLLTDNIYSSASQLLIDYIYEYFNGIVVNDAMKMYGDRKTVGGGSGHPAKFFTSNNFSLHRNTYDAIGGFDPRFKRNAAEDRGFCQRCVAQGIPLLYFPDILIHHFHHLSLKSFWRQHFNYGAGAFQFYLLCRAEEKDNISEGFRVQAKSPKPDPNFYRKLLSFPFRYTLPRKQQLQLVTLLLLSQVATAAGYYSERQHQQGLS